MKFTVKLAVGIAVILLVLPIAYVASSGPAFWFAEHQWETRKKAFPVTDKYFTKVNDRGYVSIKWFNRFMTPCFRPPKPSVWKGRFTPISTSGIFIG